MTTKILTLLTFALAIAWGATAYHVNLAKPAVVGGTELKAGDYKVEVNGNKVTLKSGKSTVEAEATVENGGAKFSQSSACCLADDGKYRLQELRIGGTNTKLIFKDSGRDALAGGH